MEAEIRESVKESGIKQLNSRLSKIFSDCLFHFKLNWGFGAMIREHDKQVKNHCSKGFHRLGRVVQSRTWKNRKTQVEYLECSICRKFKFFSTVKDKNRYLKISSNRRRYWK